MATAVADIADGETFSIEEKSFLEQEQTTAVESVDQAEKPAEEKPETVTTEQANKLLGKITLYDECVTRIVDVQSDIDEEEDEDDVIATDSDNSDVASEAEESEEDHDDVENDEGMDAFDLEEEEAESDE